MKTRNGYLQGYNAQAMVTKEQIIVAVEACLLQAGRMEQKLLTKQGKKLYKWRSQAVEPVFGQIKEGRACGRFLRRGLAAARSEWRLICAAHNLLKLWRSGKLHLAMQQRQGCSA